MFDMNKILEMWNKEFPALKKYTNRSILINIKPFLIGLRLMKTGMEEEYRVYFEIYPLWREKERFYTLVFEELMSKNGFQIFIRWRAHEEKFSLALESTKAKYGRLLNRQINLTDFIYYMLIHKKDINSQFTTPDWQIPIFQIFFGLAIYLDNKSLMDYAKKLLEQEIKRWRKIRIMTQGIYHYETINGKSKKRLVPGSREIITYSADQIEEYKNEIFEDFKDRKQFFDRIEENCKRPKIAKLNVGEFVNIEEFEPPKSFWEKLTSLFKRAELNIDINTRSGDLLTSDNYE